MENEKKFNPQAIVEVFQNAFTKLDFQKIVDIYKRVFSFNADFWPQAKEEAISVKEIYERYLVVLSLLPAVGSFIMTSRLLNLDNSIKIINLIVGYLTYLVMPYIGAYVVEKIASYFGGNVTFENAFKLIAYSMLPGLAAGLLNIFASVLFSFLALLVSFVGLYLLWNGIETMTGVPAEKKLPFFITFVGIMIVICMVLTMLR